ncbi:extracellular solute-binding protein [Paenibacillus sp. XY044]|uniref:extracellular solute-binding protein n=1 Tax=Paenibacillus sp. XY044 TaxID=2026089 RepID=UPI0015C62E82|nr:extracellular solute-binding protein [Paenibacillus sp. XY044]
MRRKNYWLLFAILLLSLTTLSQGQELSQTPSGHEEEDDASLFPQPSTQERTSQSPIRVIVHLSNEDFKQLVELNHTYVSDTGATVELNNIPDADAYLQLKSALSVGEGPDVMLINSSWVRPMASRGYLLPVESYTSNRAESDTINPLLQEVEWNGYQWGTPADMNPYVLVWNKKALNSLGMTDIPGDISSWKDLLSKAKNRGHQKLLEISSGDGYDAAALLGALGTDPLNPSQISLEWIDKARAFMQIDHDPQDASGTQLPLTFSAVSEAAGTQTADMVLRMPEQLYAVYPSLLRSRSYAVSAGSQHAKEAAEWIAYMSSAVVQQKWYQATGKLPALKSLYDDTVFNPAGLPFHLTSLLQTAGTDKDAGRLQAKWDLFIKASGEYIAGKSTAGEYAEAVGGEAGGS